jgi:dihydroxyacetone kinase-like protein
MKKLINHVDTVLDESLDGFAAAHADIVSLGPQREFVRRLHTKPGKVALISGGSSGHEPLHAGFVGHGMLDAACPGQIFTSPTPNQMLAAAEGVDTGAGVLFIVKNYSGDMMNFQMAAEMLDRDNATVIVNDDVAVENSTYTTGRRGVAGTLIVEKIVGAAAERGDSLVELKTLGDAVNKATASMGVALSSCTVPAAGKPTFQIGVDEMEMGVGIHGEPGRRRVKIATADEIAAELTGAVLKDLSLPRGQQAILLVNVVRHLTGSYVTSLEMAGCSITVTAVDADTLALWDAPVHTAALRWGM